MTRGTRRVLLALFMLMAVSPAAFPQSTATPVQFDVASIRSNTTASTSGSIARSGGSFTVTNESLRAVIAFAYGIAIGRDYELTAPAWTAAAKFDIDARMPADTSRKAVRDMLQALLAARFSLKTHREDKKVTAFALVVDRRGTSLKMSSSRSGSFSFGDGHIAAEALSMASFAARLSGPPFNLGRPVMNQTGLEGTYDFELNWTPDSVLEVRRDGPSLVTAVQEQLGLKLEPSETTIRVLIVDSVNRLPTEN